MTKRATRRQLSRMVDQLQVLEMAKGAEYMMGSRLNHEFEILKDQYEARTGCAFKYKSC
jgi:hypothetical protein